MWKVHNKTPDDLNQYWHENPSESNGIQIPARSQYIFSKFVVLGIVFFALLSSIPILYNIPNAYWALCIFRRSLSFAHRLNLTCFLQLPEWFLLWLLEHWYAHGKQMVSSSYVTHFTLLIGWFVFIVFLSDYLSSLWHSSVVELDTSFARAQILFFVPEMLWQSCHLNRNQRIGVDIAN